MLQQRLRVTIQGAVQGVGFRPFIYRLATDLKLVGWVNNSTTGVVIEVEGTQTQLDKFLLRIEKEKPPQARIYNLETFWLDCVGYKDFQISNSTSSEKTAVILPDIATCPECLQEIFNPNNRRYRYPFTNCTNCGPRFSIINALPYDRPNTTMQQFVMCVYCQAEYENPLNRRFHAQPNACSHCGPHLELWDGKGKVLASHDTALQMAVNAIRSGKIIAIKGLGGFHLMVDARSVGGVQRLRVSKRREEKAFALMYPNIELVKAHCQVSNLEEQLLHSPEAPIVLLRRKKDGEWGVGSGEWGIFPESWVAIAASEVAPNNPYLGVMLPYTPLHHLLMAELGFPVVATSGNISDEPICIDEYEALQRLENIADLFLVHNRPIARPVDDSIVRIVMGREMVLRRSRGYAPLPILINSQSNIQNPKSKILALGAHLKNTIAVTTPQSREPQILISQHIGDLDTIAAFESFKKTIASFQQLYELEANAIATDLHPDYRSTQFASQLGASVIPVQHHYAHVLSCMAENQLNGSVLGIVLDGTGYGLDGTIWGGEFLLVNNISWQRVAHLPTLRLPGGDKAVKEPRRSAMGLLYELFGDAVFEMPNLAPVKAFSERELLVLKTMLQRHINTPLTSSCGRLFDAIASILGLRHQTKFEGQAAMDLEFALEGVDTDEQYNFEIIESPIIIDYQPAVKEILLDINFGLAVSKISAKFHNTLVEIIVRVAKLVGEERVVLTGGCFQNKYLTERAIKRLSAEKFRPYWHQRIPPNDGGIALGQIMAAFRELRLRENICV